MRGEEGEGREEGRRKGRRREGERELALFPPLIDRHYVISHLPRLEHLDDTEVTREEREKALKVYGRRRPGNTSGSAQHRAGSVKDKEPASSTSFVSHVSSWLDMGLLRSVGNFGY